MAGRVAKILFPPGSSGVYRRIKFLARASSG